jgi:hypothetical protein
MNHVLSSAVGRTTSGGRGHDEHNRHPNDSRREMLSVETSSCGKAGNNEVQTLVGFFNFFCGCKAQYWAVLNG